MVMAAAIMMAEQEAGRNLYAGKKSGAKRGVKKSLGMYLRLAQAREQSIAKIWILEL